MRPILIRIGPAWIHRRLGRISARLSRPSIRLARSSVECPLGAIGRIRSPIRPALIGIRLTRTRSGLDRTDIPPGRTGIPLKRTAPQIGLRRFLVRLALSAIGLTRPRRRSAWTSIRRTLFPVGLPQTCIGLTLNRIPVGLSRACIKLSRICIRLA